jgi:hypothetical protein
MRGSHPQSVVYRSLPADPALAAPITLAWHRDDGDALTQRFLALVRRMAGAQPPAGAEAARGAGARRSRAKSAAPR